MDLVYKLTSAILSKDKNTYSDIQTFRQTEISLFHLSTFHKLGIVNKLYQFINNRIVEFILSMLKSFPFVSLGLNFYYLTQG